MVENGAIVGIVTPHSLLLGVKGNDLRARGGVGQGENVMDTSAIADTFDSLIDDALIWVSDHGAFLFDCVRAVFEGFYDGVLWPARDRPLVRRRDRLRPPRLAPRQRLVRRPGRPRPRRLRLMGLWPETMSTFALVISATVLALVLAHADRGAGGLPARGSTMSSSRSST